MGNIRFKASKKTLVILFLILFLILGGSGGYLLWRVNQSKTVAPTDSSAGGTEIGCGPDGCNCLCSSGRCTCGCPGQLSCYGSGADCNVPRCIWPYVAWFLADTGEGNCACAHRTRHEDNKDYRCNDKLPKCTPSPCPPGYTDMHRPGGGTEFEPSNYSAEDFALIDAAKLFDHKTSKLCSENPGSELCYTECGQGYPPPVRCEPCNNPYAVRRMCKKAPPNTCDGVGSYSGGIVLSTRTPEHCKPVTFDYTVGDTDGVGKVTVKLNGSDIAFTEKVVGKTKKITGTIPGDKNCNTNKRTLTISWVDIHGAGGSLCTKSVEYTPKAPPNTCDGVGSYSGGIVLSTRTPEHCKPVTFDYTVGDTDGVGKVTVKLNGSDIAFTEKVVGKTKKITGTIPGDKNCDTNKRTLTISWVDIHGTGGSLCTKSVEYTPKAAPDTTCDPSKAGWVNDPKGGKFETCKAPVEYSYKVADPQGVNLGSIVVTLNGQKITPSKVEPNTGTPTVATVSGKLNTTTACLPPGSKTIKIVWKDKNGNPRGTQEPCTAQTTFTIEAKNTCDAIGAGWKDKVAPPNETVEGKGIVAHYITADKDGVGSIEVLFNNTPLTSVSKVPSADGTKVTITITIPPTKLTVGNHMLQISWKDKLGIGGEKPCKVVHDIVVRERPVPDWDIEKVAKEECIDDGTENPISKITNTITIKNEGNEEGIIQKVVDTLDAKVVGSTVSGITEAGEHTNGKITWSGFRPIPAGGTKVLRYSYTVAKDKFDIYKNSVIATVEGGGTLDAGATIEARCNVVNPSCGDGNLDTALGEQCDPPGSSCTNAYGESNVCTDSCTCPGEPPSIPETGIFDDSRKVVVMGAVLLFTGIGWTWLSSTYKLVNGKLVQRRKENFEQRVVKR